MKKNLSLVFAILCSNSLIQNGEVMELSSRIKSTVSYLMLYELLCISVLINIQSAVSMYCRLGFAKKKGAENVNTEDLHPSWREIQPANKK